MIAVIAVALLLIAAAAVGFHIANTAMAGRRQTLEEARAWQESHYDLSWYDPLEKEDYTVTGEGGYVLHAQLLKNPAADGRFVIISHGYTDNRFGALKYASMYLDQGFSVVIAMRASRSSASTANPSAPRPPSPCWKAGRRWTLSWRTAVSPRSPRCSGASSP